MSWCWVDLLLLVADCGAWFDRRSGFVYCGGLCLLWFGWILFVVWLVSVLGGVFAPGGLGCLRCFVLRLVFAWLCIVCWVTFASVLLMLVVW